MHRNLSGAVAAARELSWLDLKDSLDLLMLMGEKGDPRYERAAARWVSRLFSERELEVGESALAVAAVGALTGRSGGEALAVLEELVRRPRHHRRTPSSSST
jgi:hypothetical protein